MGDVNQYIYGTRHLQPHAGSVLEIGSKNYGNTQDFRSYFKAARYVGVDLEEGAGVDLVHDISTGLGPLPTAAFDVALCLSVLEHVQRPWLAAEFISATIASDGLLYISIPWVQRFHAYPDDYWRMSPSAIKTLFPDFEWGTASYSTNEEGIFFEIGPKQREDNKLHIMHRGRKYLPYLFLHMIGKKK